MRNVAQFSETNCRVDEIAQYNLAGFHVTGKKVFDTLAKKRLAETRIALRACPDCFLEISLVVNRSQLDHGKTGNQSKMAHVQSCDSIAKMQRRCAYQQILECDAHAASCPFPAS
jgi:hypothetical protein